MDGIGQHRFGVNYTPTRNWYYSWNDFEPAAIARDFDAIAGLGMDHIRLMTLWPAFHPNPDWVSPAHLERLATVMELAGQRGLDVLVTLLTGWLSGYAFRPAYVKGEGFYSAEAEWAHQERYIREVAAAVGGQANFLGFDIGNEINCCWSTGADTAQGDAWMERVLGLMEELCPGKAHVNGVDHQPWFFPQTFSPQALAMRPSIVALHCWIYFTGALRRGGPLEPPSVRLAAAMAALARAHAGDAAKPIWVQEYGASTEWMDVAVMPQFVERATVAGIEEGVSWFTWWASHDIDRRLRFASLEYDLGLLTVDNRVKDHGRAFGELAAAYRGKEAGASPRGLCTPPAKHDREATWEWLLEWMAG